MSELNYITEMLELKKIILNFMIIVITKKKLKEYLLVIILWWNVYIYLLKTLRKNRLLDILIGIWFIMNLIFYILND